MSEIKSPYFTILIVLFLICFGNNISICQNHFDREDVEITGDTLIALGQSATLTASPGFKSYLWNTEEALEEITVSPEITTKYWVDATSQDDLQSSDTIVVTVKDYIIDHSDLNIIHEPGQPDSLWVELDEDATPEWSNGSFENYIIVNPVLNKTYTLNVIVDEEVVQELVYSIKMANVIEFTYDTVCLGDSTTFINTSVTGDTVSQILWDLDGDTEFDDAEGDTVAYKYETDGNYLVGMRVYFTNSTLDVIYNAVPVGDIPIVDFQIYNLCYTSTTNFIDESIVNTKYIESWYWDFGDGRTSTNQNPTNLFGAPQSYTVSLSVTSNYGCFNTAEKSFDILAISEIELITDDNVPVYENDTVIFNQGQEITITVSNSDYDSIIWFNGDRANSITIVEEGLISVNAYDEGCETTRKFFTSWGNTPGPSGDNIMNLFTPNGDGVNDNWIVGGQEIIQPTKVNVYNRSGRQVYANNNYDNSWDGQFNGNPLPQATYYYIIEDATGQFFKGAITIIR